MVQNYCHGNCEVFIERLCYCLGEDKKGKRWMEKGIEMDRKEGQTERERERERVQCFRIILNNTYYALMEVVIDAASPSVPITDM